MMNPAFQQAVVDAGMSHVQPAGWMPVAQVNGKNQSVTAAHIAEKQAWLGQHAKSEMSDGHASAPANLSIGKNSGVTSAQVAEKEAWLAQQGGRGTDMARGKMSEGYAVSNVRPMNGQGGPDESSEAHQMTLPACRPGPGDDRCIQMHERGMSRAYAQWVAGRSNAGMGGPEEFVDEKTGMTSASGMSAAAKGPGPSGPTTEPTGVRAVGKSAMSTTMSLQGSFDMAGLDPLEDDGMAAEQMLGAA
jgi:hypothetical protein